MELSELANITPVSNFNIGDGGSNYITVDGAGNMTVSGVVIVDPNAGASLGGDFNIAKAGAQDTISYTGSGSLYVSGTIQIDASLVTAGANSFPSNIIGFMTPNRIGFNEANIDVMGLFYAENEIKVQKQTDILGTIASNFFDLGTNVPAIYQVPDTTFNVPAGMINGNVYWYIVVAWIKT